MKKKTKSTAKGSVFNLISDKALALALAGGLLVSAPLAFADPVHTNSSMDTAQSATLIVALKTDQRTGAVMIALFDSADAYSGKGSPVRAVRIDLDQQQDDVKAVFEGLIPGTYAMRAFHDVNGDGQLNQNAFGAPIEPFAFSANAVVRFGPPTFDAAALTLNKGANSDTLDFRKNK